MSRYPAASNVLANIAAKHIKARLPGAFAHLTLRYGIADEVLDAIRNDPDVRAAARAILDEDES